MDVTELAAAVAAQNEATGVEVDAGELLEAMDADGDGVVFVAEFARGSAGSDASGAVFGERSRQPLQRLMAVSGYDMYRMMGSEGLWNMSGDGLSFRA